MMAKPRTSAANRRLQQTLAQWQQWQCTPVLPGSPHVEGPLAGGHSNHSFLVSAATQRFVVRIDGVAPARHGLNRQIEWRALQSASRAGIAPTPRYFNPDLGALVVDFHERDPDSALSATSVARLLRRIHAQPHVHHRVDISERIARYEQRLDRGASLQWDSELQRAVHARLERAVSEQCRPVLTHNDLLPGNLLFSGGRLMALDWEYCGMGSAWFDIAVASLELGSDPADLLTAYRGNTASHSELQRLRDYRVVARYLEYLWHLTESPEDQHSHLQQRYRPAIESELNKA